MAACVARRRKRRAASLEAKAPRSQSGALGSSEAAQGGDQNNPLAGMADRGPPPLPRLTGRSNGADSAHRASSARDAAPRRGARPSPLRSETRNIPSQLAQSESASLASLSPAVMSLLTSGTTREFSGTSGGGADKHARDGYQFDAKRRKTDSTVSPVKGATFSQQPVFARSDRVNAREAAQRPFFDYMRGLDTARTQAEASLKSPDTVKVFDEALCFICHTEALQPNDEDKPLQRESEEGDDDDEEDDDSNDEESVPKIEVRRFLDRARGCFKVMHATCFEERLPVTSRVDQRAK